MSSDEKPRAPDRSCMRQPIKPQIWGFLAQANQNRRPEGLFCFSLQKEPAKRRLYFFLLEIPLEV